MHLMLITPEHSILPTPPPGNAHSQPPLSLNQCPPFRTTLRSTASLPVPQPLSQTRRNLKSTPVPHRPCIHNPRKLRTTGTPSTPAPPISYPTIIPPETGSGKKSHSSHRRSIRLPQASHPTATFPYRARRSGVDFYASMDLYLGIRTSFAAGVEGVAVAVRGEGWGKRGLCTGGSIPVGKESEMRGMR